MKIIKQFTLEIADSLYNSEEEFPVNFDLAWKWLEYSSKQKAKDFLVKNFVEGIDFNLQVELGSLDDPRPKERISTTIETLKIWAMMAATEKGKLIRKYFLECEKIAKQKTSTRTTFDLREAIAALTTDQLLRLEVAHLHKCGKYFDPELLSDIDPLFWDMPFDVAHLLFWEKESENAKLWIDWYRQQAEKSEDSGQKLNEELDQLGMNVLLEYEEAQTELRRYSTLHNYKREEYFYSLEQKMTDRGQQISECNRSRKRRLQSVKRILDAET